MAKNKEASEMLGYGLKIAIIPRRLVITRSGCFLLKSQFRLLGTVAVGSRT